MPTITLSNGQLAHVDADDFDYLSQWRWTRMRVRRTSYAKRSIRVNSVRVTILMHRLIAERMGIASALIDHRDGDGLNNRRTNIRPATTAQNGWNQRTRTTSQSGFRGVHWCNRSRRWVARITASGIRRYIGAFDTPEAAADAYNQAAAEIYGEFAPSSQHPA